MLCSSEFANCIPQSSRNCENLATHSHPHYVHFNSPVLSHCRPFITCLWNSRPFCIFDPPMNKDFEREVSGDWALNQLPFLEGFYFQLSGGTGTSFFIRFAPSSPFVQKILTFRKILWKGGANSQKGAVSKDQLWGNIGKLTSAVH